MPESAALSPAADRCAPGLVFALVGAECTGKSTLARDLAGRLAIDTGLRCTWVPEHLRSWCEQAGRTPRIDEQRAIADTQGRLIDEAAAAHDLVIADTTPLMTAAYQRQVFGDDSLDGMALQWHRQVRLSLLTALDLPWQPDGLQRDGPHVREPVDTVLRQLLNSRGLPFVVIGGQGASRTEAALDAVARSLRDASGFQPPSPGLLSRLMARDAERQRAEARRPQRLGWQAWCECCDDPGCEHAAFKLRDAVSLKRG